jgi:hypothetical protein
MGDQERQNQMLQMNSNDTQALEDKILVMTNQIKLLKN